MGLRHILSIGYEIECGVLAKLTQTDVGGELVLYNSDSARKDIEELKRLEEDPDADVEDYILERQEEVMTDVIQLCCESIATSKQLNLREPNWACSKLTRKVF